MGVCITTLRLTSIVAAMSNGIRSLPRYQSGGPVSSGIKGLWEDIRKRADDPSLGYMAASMAPFVGPGTDLVEIGAGAEDFVKADKYDALKRIMFGIAGLALPFASAATIRAGTKKFAPILKTSPRLSQHYMYGDAAGSRVGRLIRALGGSNPDDHPMDFLSAGPPIQMKSPTHVRGLTMDDLLGYMTRGEKTDFHKGMGSSPTLGKLQLRANARDRGLRAVDKILSRPSTKSGIRTLSTPGDLERYVEPVERLFGQQRHIPRGRGTRGLKSLQLGPGHRLRGVHQTTSSLLTGNQQEILRGAVARHADNPEDADVLYSFIEYLTGEGSNALEEGNIDLLADSMGMTSDFVSKLGDIADDILVDPDTPDDLRDLIEYSIGKSNRMIWPWDD